MLLQVMSERRYVATHVVVNYELLWCCCTVSSSNVQSMEASLSPPWQKRKSTARVLRVASQVVVVVFQTAQKRITTQTSLGSSHKLLWNQSSQTVQANSSSFVASASNLTKKKKTNQLRVQNDNGFSWNFINLLQVGLSSVFTHTRVRRIWSITKRRSCSMDLP